MNYYMHTLNGMPAFFDERNGQVFEGNAIRFTDLRKSTATIKKEQRISVKNKKELGLAFKVHGYIIIREFPVQKRDSQGRFVKGK